MITVSNLQEIQRLYSTHGSLNYGENITQMEHALQCAALAQEAGASHGLIVASLLHDLGHLLEEEARVTQFSEDHCHQLTGAYALSGLFGEEVCQPIALHVAAKRYLCFMEPKYSEGLSAASQKSLRLQGGAFKASEANNFEQNPHWREAVALRRFDDTGKRETSGERSFAEFMPLLHSLWTAHSQSK